MNKWFLRYSLTLILIATLILSLASTTPVMAQTDTDGDSLTDHEEVVTYGTDPNNPDSDSDGLNDYDEVISYGTNPNDWDSDDD